MRINVLIASPGDVASERLAVPRIFTRWNDANDAFLHPVMWESSAVPTLGDHPQHLLDNQLIEKSELLIAVLWSRLGTPTPTDRSGTLEEIREFIKAKGPKRVMVYFCTRAVPHDIDIEEFKRLREFKKEMSSQGLFHEFGTTDEFEREVYHHLDVKVAELLDGRLPLPEKELHKTKPKIHGDETSRTAQPLDPRLRTPIDFGTTLAVIASGFAARLAEFQKIDGGGPDKFLALGAHVYSSCADCLDRALLRSGSTLSAQDKAGIDRSISRLRHLAESSAGYLKTAPFPRYWKEGSEIAEDLTTRVHHIAKVSR